MAALEPQPPPLEELGAVGSQQDAARLLSSKLEVLKADLVSVQQQLRQRRSSGRRSPPRERVSDVTPRSSARGEASGVMLMLALVAQEPDPHQERPLASRPERSSSLQEIFSSPRNKLLRQSSLQQQQVSALHVVCTCWELLSLLH